MCVGVSPPNSNVDDVGVLYLNYMWSRVFDVREKIPVRMLEITPQIVNALDVNVTYVQPYSQTTYTNNVKVSKFDVHT